MLMIFASPFSTHMCSRLSCVSIQTVWLPLPDTAAILASSSDAECPVSMLKSANQGQRVTFLQLFGILSQGSSSIACVCVCVCFCLIACVCPSVCFCHAKGSKRSIRATERACTGFSGKCGGLKGQPVIGRREVSCCLLGGGHRSVRINCARTYF